MKKVADATIFVVWTICALCFHIPDLLRCKMSCKLTGMKSGIRRSPCWLYFSRLVLRLF